MTFYARHKIRPCTRLSAIKSYNIRFPGRRISRNPVKQGRSVSCRCYNILERGFRVSRRIEERFCISPAEDGCGGEPQTSEKKTKPLGVFWGSYYTVTRRDSLSTVWGWSSTLLLKRKFLLCVFHTEWQHFVWKDKILFIISCKVHHSAWKA